MNFCVSFIDNRIIRSDINNEWILGIELQHFLISVKINEKPHIFNYIGSKKNTYSIFCEEEAVNNMQLHRKRAKLNEKGKNPPKEGYL